MDVQQKKSCANMQTGFFTEVFPTVCSCLNERYSRRTAGIPLPSIPHHTRLHMSLLRIARSAELVNTQHSPNIYIPVSIYQTADK